MVSRLEFLRLRGARLFLLELGDVELQLLDTCLELLLLLGPLLRVPVRVGAGYFELRLRCAKVRLGCFLTVGERGDVPVVVGDSLLELLLLVHELGLHLLPFLGELRGLLGD